MKFKTMHMYKLHWHQAPVDSIAGLDQFFSNPRSSCSGVFLEWKCAKYSWLP